MCAAQGVNPDSINIFINPDNPDRSLLRLISRNPVLPLHEFVAPGSEAAGITCMKALVVGSAHMHLTLARSSALPFRWLLTTKPVHVGQAERQTMKISLVFLV